jgi:hypothetical protein
MVAQGASDQASAQDFLARNSTKYKEFVTLQYSSHTFLIAAVANSIVNLVVFSDASFLTNFSKMTTVQVLFESFTISLRFSVVCMMWIVWAYKTDGSVLNYKASANIVDASWLSLLQSLCPVLMTVVLSVELVFNAGYEPLNHQQLYIVACAIKVWPLVSAFILRDTNPVALGIAWALCIIALLVNGLRAQAFDLLADTGAYAFTTWIVLYDTYRHNMNVFRLVTKLLDTLKENEALAVEAQALELRAMIGNVAHDLKTVSYLPALFFPSFLKKLKLSRLHRLHLIFLLTA